MDRSPGGALAQQTNTAPPISEMSPTGSKSAVANAAATDLNQICLSLGISVVVMAIWSVVRRRRSRTTR